MSLTCLSRTLDPADYAQLPEELTLVDRAGVPPLRRWEYALALHAIARWSDADPLRHWSDPIYDVIGEDAQFAHLVAEQTGRETEILDVTHHGSLNGEVRGGRPLADVITCLGIIEHIPEPESFLYHLSCLLAPGGLLVLTFAFWNRCGQDTAVGHEQRQRIYCPKLYSSLRSQADTLHLHAFGGVDPTWHGTQRLDHTVASLVLEKRR